MPEDIQNLKSTIENRSGFRLKIHTHSIFHRNPIRVHPRPSVVLLISMLSLYMPTQEVAAEVVGAVAPDSVDVVAVVLDVGDLH